MFKVSTSIFLLSSAISVTANYGDTSATMSAQNYQSRTSGQASEQSFYPFNPHMYGRFPGYGQIPYPKVKFPEPLPIIDPNQHRDILSLFGQCKELKCTPDKIFKEDIHESIATLGEYASCITGCAAEQIFKTIVNYKHLLGDLFDIGTDKLVQARKYISGEGTFEVVETGTRIDDSCCLPNENFVPFEDIIIAAELKPATGTDFGLNVATITRMISVKTYLDICSGDKVLDFEDSLKIECDSSWTEYLLLMQRNVGHLILTPESFITAPHQSCDENGIDNPRAAKITSAICRAILSKRNNVDYPISLPILKSIATTTSSPMMSCPDDIVRDDKTNIIDTIVYEQLESGKSPFYIVKGGLPSKKPVLTTSAIGAAIKTGDTSTLQCTYDQTLTNPDDTFKVATPPSSDAIEAATVCPDDGLFEYCNVQQYATYLSKQLYDNSRCSTIDIASNGQGSAGSLSTLNCLYKTISLKCDCMEAVLNCYEHQFSFTSQLSKTIGKSASVLCGFVLCLKPSVYSLFHGQGAIEKADIMRGLLTQVGISVPSVSSMPAATFAFLAFGIGMIAFVVTKIISRNAKKSISIDDGYAQLI